MKSTSVLVLALAFVLALGACVPSSFSAADRRETWRHEPGIQAHGSHRTL
jgi:hypothetical protein